ncbi:MAG: hypothetical protein LC437_09600 [Thiohalomonas sp.]|nr:hypothetical protein [Thiohalomonas sp.]
MPNVPVAYINSPEYQKYFAWLMFDEEVEIVFAQSLNIRTEALSNLMTINGDI